MKQTLLWSALVKFLLGAALVGALIFLPAGTLGFANGWLLMGILFIPMLVVGVILMLRNPSLLEKRLKSKEKQSEQNIVVKLSGLMFLFGFVVAGFGVRFDWYRLPMSVSLVASVVFLLGYAMYAEVLRENAYLSRTIEVQEGQRVIDTGLYGVVRHPMYAATLLMFLSIPLILGSWHSFVIFLLYVPLIAVRIIGEESLLDKELDGYRDYKRRVKYRLVPYVW